jgi:hypothetical protein
MSGRPWDHSGAVKSGEYVEACHCPERQKPIASRAWFVYKRRHNHSAFNGYHYTPPAWSSVHCPKCRVGWRTKAKYVDKLPDGKL